MTAVAPREGATACPRCNSSVVVVYSPPAVIETRRAEVTPVDGAPVYFEHTSARCRTARVDQRRAIRPFLERSSFGCPSTPGCGGLLSEHRHDGHDSNGDLINPRCPEVPRARLGRDQRQGPRRPIGDHPR